MPEPRFLLECSAYYVCHSWIYKDFWKNKCIKKTVEFKAVGLECLRRAQQEG